MSWNFNVRFLIFIQKMKNLNLIFPAKLIEERDLWASSAHMLSLKVTDKHNLVTVRRLHLYQKGWHKLANRFTVLLGQTDAKQV